MIGYMKADVVVYDKNGQLAAIIEAKNIKGKPRKWAIEMRRNLYEYGFFPN